eukprot:4479343-Amphidinium_carterae.1
MVLPKLWLQLQDSGVLKYYLMRLLLQGYVLQLLTPLNLASCRIDTLCKPWVNSNMVSPLPLGAARMLQFSSVTSRLLSGAYCACPECWPCALGGLSLYIMDCCSRRATRRAPKRMALCGWHERPPLASS